jgi:branched-chain amino acid transport system permease protein
MRVALPKWALPAAWGLVLAFLLAAPFLGASNANIRLLTLIAILALTVSGLNLTLGYTGELALGQAAIYAGGAYAAGFVAKSLHNDVLLALVASILVAVVIGLIAGAPGLRLGGWTLAITSFFLVLLIPSIVNVFGHALGGYEGMKGIPIPRLFGHRLNNDEFYLVVVVVAAAWFALFRNLVVSRHGAVLLVLKQSPVLAEALGTSTYATKLKAYVLGAIPAGIAGCFAAYLDSFLSPVSFNLELSIIILAASILGGSMSVYGAIVGAAIMQIGPLRVTVFDRYAFVAFGAFLILGGLLLRNGLTGILNGLLSRVIKPKAAPAAASADLALTPVQGRTLEVIGVSKRFGGNQAVSDVSFEARPGRITALIGPNGSGKTTTMNLISGFYTPDEGTIRLGGEVISGLPTHKVARKGVGRTFQSPLIPEGLSVRDVIVTGRMASHPVSILHTILRLPKHRRALAEENRAAEEIMAQLGLSRWRTTPAADLALGTRRMLELGRAIAGGGSLVLLDEVASGLDEQDIQELVRVLTKMREAGLTVVLVEHNFSLVRSIADEVVVLAEGRVIAKGTPDEIAANPEVVSVYLGEGMALSGTQLNPRDGDSHD